MVVRETESVLSPRRMARRRKARGKPDKPRRRTDPAPTAAQQISTLTHHISKPAVLGFVFFHHVTLEINAIFSLLLSWLGSRVR